MCAYSLTPFLLLLCQVNSVKFGTKVSHHINKAPSLYWLPYSGRLRQFCLRYVGSSVSIACHGSIALHMLSRRAKDAPLTFSTYILSRHIVVSTPFDYFVLSCIVISCITLALSDTLLEAEYVTYKSCLAKSRTGSRFSKWCHPTDSDSFPTQDTFLLQSTL